MHRAGCRDVVGEESGRSWSVTAVLRGGGHRDGGASSSSASVPVGSDRDAAERSDPAEPDCAPVTYSMSYEDFRADAVELLGPELTVHWDAGDEVPQRVR